MIVFDLKCGHGHVFEAWFGSSEDYAEQRARNLVACPICEDRAIEKAVMAPSVGPKGNQTASDMARKEALRELAALQARLESECDYVGADFVAEARRRHKSAAAGPDDETPSDDSARSDAEAGKPQVRGIYGEASLADAVELLSEGIEIAPLPFRPRQRADA